MSVNHAEPVDPTSHKVKDDVLFRTEPCTRCNGTGIVIVLIDSLLFEDRRFCTRCAVGAEKARQWAELLRQASAEDATED